MKDLSEVMPDPYAWYDAEAEKKRKARADQLGFKIIHALVHPKYDNALYDVALLKTDAAVDFLPGQIQPICLPFGGHFPDIRTDAVVAGWGSLKNTACHTGPNGPSPNSKCVFPFASGGRIFHDCAYGPNPSAKDPLCKSLKEDMPGELGHERDEIVLIPSGGEIDSPSRKCYR